MHVLQCYSAREAGAKHIQDTMTWMGVCTIRCAGSHSQPQLAASQHSTTVLREAGIRLGAQLPWPEAAAPKKRGAGEASIKAQCNTIVTLLSCSNALATRFQE
jgi:hypothetical protein